MCLISQTAWADGVYGRQPQPGTQFNSTRPTVSATFPEGVKASQIFVDGTEFTGQAQRSGQTIKWTPNYNLDYGNHTVMVVGTGVFGNKVKDSWSFTLTNAAVAPAQPAWSAQVAGVNPANDMVVHLTRPTVSARFSGTVNPAMSQIWVDGQDFTAQSSRSNTGISWTPTWDIDPGQHRVHLRAQGANGVALQKDWVFYVDATKAVARPVTNLNDIAVSPADQSKIDQNAPSIKAAFPAGVNPASLRLMVDKVDVTGMCQRDNHRIVYHPAQPLSPGPHKAKVTGQDKTGQSIEKLWHFEVMGNQAPAQPFVRMESPTQGMSVLGRFTVSGYALPNSRVQVVTKSGTPNPKVFEGYSDNNGKFAIDAHAPGGQQRLLIVPFNYNNTPIEPTEITVNVQ
jgi:hypothetical protein